MLTLVAQRGHVGRTTGKTGTRGEQAMAIGVSAELVKQAPPGWRALCIDADVRDSLYAGDAFVAIHGDGSLNPSADGACAGYFPGGAELAKAWKAAYTGVGWPGTWNRDNYTTNLSGYYGLRKALGQGNKRAIIIEVGFMTNPTERAWIDSHRADIARSIWIAVAGEANDVVLDSWWVNIAASPHNLATAKRIADGRGLRFEYRTPAGWTTDTDPAATFGRIHVRKAVAGPVIAELQGFVAFDGKMPLDDTFSGSWKNRIVK